MKQIPPVPIPPSGCALINQAVLAQCGATDGVQDSPEFVANPLLCHFDPFVCPAMPERPEQRFLTAQQIQTVLAIYKGPTDGRTGKSLFPGFTGSETLWGAIAPTARPAASRSPKATSNTSSSAIRTGTTSP